MFNSQITKTISTFPQDILKKEALSDIRGSSLTYMNILDAVSDSSDFFNGLDIKRSTRIAVIPHEEIDLALLFLVVSEKAVHVPLNHDFSKDEFSFYYDLLNIEYLLVEKSYEGPAMDGMNGFPGLGIIRYSMDEGRLSLSMVRPYEVKLPSVVEGDDTALVLTTS